MKQISIRLLAPFALVSTLANRMAQFSTRKSMWVLTMPQRMIGKWRLYLNYCPECNSCAPKIHHCDVCNADTKSYFSWNDDIKNAWWKKYSTKHKIVA